MLVALLAFGLLVYTEAGLQYALSVMPETMGQSRVEVRDVRGTLAGGFTAQYFELNHPRATVKVKKLRARVAVLPLLWRTIVVRDATIDDAFVQVFTSKRPPRKPPRFLPPFVSVRAEGARVRNAALIATNGKRFDATDVVASGSVASKTIRFYEARMKMQDLVGQGQIVIGAADVTELSGETRWVFAPANQPVWTANIDMDGDLARLKLDGFISAPFRAHFNGSADGLNTGAWRWGGKGRIEELDLRAWGGGGALGKITAQLDISGNRAGFVATGPLQSAGLNVGDFLTRFEGSYANRVITTRRLELVHRGSGASIDGAGAIGIESGGPRLTLRGAWKNFRWPLLGAEPGLRSAAGRYQLDGVWPYRLTASGPVQVADLPPLETRVAGLLGTDKLRIETGTIDLLGGRASFQGDAAWSPAERWQLAGKAIDLDTSKLRAALTGRIGFDYAASGEGYGGSENLDASFRNLTGRVRGATARGSGRVLRRGDAWEFDQVKLAAGGLLLDVDGRIAPTSRDLRFLLVASDLAVLAPGSRGQLRAAGSWRGPDSEPLIQVEATGRGIDFGGIKARDLRASINLDTRPKRRSVVDVRATSVSFLGRDFQRVALDLDGNAEANTTTFEAQFGAAVVRALADGAFSQGAWRGRWRSLQVDDQKNLHLKLAEPAAITIDLDSGDIAQFCLRGAAAQICQRASWDGAGWRANFNARDLPLAALTAGLTARTIYEGTIGGEIAIASTTGPVVGTLQASLRDARLRRTRPRGREDVLELGNGDVSLEAGRETVGGSLKLDAGQLGFLDATLDATRRDNAAGLNIDSWPLRAKIRGESRTISFLSTLSQDIDRVGGKLKVDLGLGGTIGAPRADGELVLTEGELDLYAINLAVRKLSALARVDANRLVFESDSTVGEGRLAAGGKLYWERGQLHGELRLKGSNLLAVNVPEARILASPDVVFKMDGRRIDVSGEVKLPFARIVPTDLAGAVLTSSDELLTDAPAVEKAAQTQLVANVRMTLGDQVTIDTFGLSGRLTGSIVTRTAADGSTHANGELNVAEGKYAAFGRRLDIEKGKLQFLGGLVSDPAVDIRATKQYPEVIAGVNVRGTLRAPRMTFFSTPSLPQSQIVSLILAGGSIDSAQDDTRAGATRDALLAQGSAILAQQIGSRVGVDDVSIEQNLDNSTALVLGKYLSPRLYVSYGISLAESINTIKMRYALDDRWTIRTEAGKERSAELVYTIEK
jgi:translocation and assembly module TamB